SSAVRAAAGINATVKSYDQTAVVANFACERPHLNTAWQWFTDEGVVALLPLPGANVSLVWSAPDALAAELTALSADQLASRVTARCRSGSGESGVVGALTAVGPAHTFPLRQIALSRLIGPRVALVGDAAHVVHPLAGQGLNLGLQDTELLLEVVRDREVFRNPGDEAVLRRYERGRAEALGLMRFTTDALAQLFAFDDPLVRRLRNAGLAAVNRLSPLKNALIRRALG
ncbi:MAG: FAD-dependent monooxygenase, partial [Burkholderiaceae bacterium]